MKKIFFISWFLFNVSAFSQSSAFIYGGGNLCDNAGTIDVEISLAGTQPWNIVYAIDGVSQPSVSTSSNPHIIPTKIGGVYTVVSVSDAAGIGTTSGSAIVTILQAPIAQFTIEQDTLSFLYPIAKFRDKTIGATAWKWNFGDPPINGTSVLQNPVHTFVDSIAVYQVTLIASDINGCSNTTFHQVWVNDESYIYI
ncbi:MAG TPA: hypothetical protein EYQ06_04830 [Flavobacteriales bacterium]|nr:hypothetical protein [Flavobacteriales bacterium]